LNFPFELSARGLYDFFVDCYAEKGWENSREAKKSSESSPNMSEVLRKSMIFRVQKCTNVGATFKRIDWYTAEIVVKNKTQE